MAHKGDYVPQGWSSAPMMSLVKRMRRNVDFGGRSDEGIQGLNSFPNWRCKAGTRRRNNPPEWRGMYDSSSDWFEVRTSDIVYSESIFGRGSHRHRGIRPCPCNAKSDLAGQRPKRHRSGVPVDTPEKPPIPKGIPRHQQPVHSNRRRTQSSDFGEGARLFKPSHPAKEAEGDCLKGAKCTREYLRRPILAFPTFAMRMTRDETTES